MPILVLKFIICVFVVVVLGIKLSKYASVLSKNSFFKEYIMGIFFLSAVTSFPEIFTSIGAVRLVFAPDMAVADIIGSVIFNLTIIGCLDIYIRKSILPAADNVHIIAAAFTIAMHGILILFLIVFHFTKTSFTFFNIGISSFLLVMLYFTGIAFVYKREKSGLVKEEGDKALTNGAVWIKFMIASGILIASSLWLAKIGKEIVDKSGLTEMAVGAVLLAITTSLPELVVCLTALKIGEINLAVGNVLGSNLFNLLVIPVCDVVVRKGAFVSFLSARQIIPASIAVLLTGIVILGITVKKKKAILGINWYTILILAISSLWYASLFIKLV